MGLSMILFWIVVAFALAGVAVYWMRPGTARTVSRGPFVGHAYERDPVCGMEVDVSRATGHREYGGRFWWFCSSACMAKFDIHPDEYAHQGGVSTPIASSHGT